MEYTREKVAEMEKDAVIGKAIAGLFKNPKLQKSLATILGKGKSGAKGGWNKALTAFNAQKGKKGGISDPLEWTLRGIKSKADTYSGIFSGAAPAAAKGGGSLKKGLGIGAAGLGLGAVGTVGLAHKLNQRKSDYYYPGGYK